MTQFTRRIAVAGAAAVALSISVGTTIATAGQDAPPGYAPSWLALNTTKAAGNTVQKWTVGPDGHAVPSEAVQDLSLTPGTNCDMTSTGADYLAFSGNTGSQGVGLSAGAIGVRERKTSAGESCSAVDAVSGESLTLSLRSGVGALVAASASLDLNLKGDTVIEATATGVAGSRTYRLVSGTSTDETVFSCTLPTSSGPDNGTSNNCRWDISGPSWTNQEDGFVFDTLRLTAITGSFSLMGGADGEATTPTPLPAYFGATGPSVFELVDGIVKCGDTVSATPKDKVAKSTWKRLGNLTQTGSDSNPATCTPYPYTASTGLTSDGKPLAEFKKPFTYQANSQALWENTFLYEGNAVPPVYMDLDGDTTTNPDGTVVPVGFFLLQPCSASWYDKRGTFVGPANSTQVTAPYACLVSALKGKNVGTSKSAIYTAYVFGDAGMRN